MYSRLSLSMDREVADYRRRLLAGLCGRVIEIGAGNGLNFRHYPPEVTAVVAVEPEPYLRDRALRSAALAPVPIEVIPGLAERIARSDAGFDAAIASLVLCSVDDPSAALRELYRVLRPGGELRFFEHVRADTPRLQKLQDVLDATIWPWLLGGCHAGRDTVASLQASGFEVYQLEHFRFPEKPAWNPTSPHVIGSAFRQTSKQLPSPSVL
jgi:ubiquinone/menaquinone biosynthesis C-methylase UbiE